MFVKFKDYFGHALQYLFFDLCQAYRIDTEPKSIRCGTIGKYVTKMSITNIAQYLYALHTM